MKKDHAARKPDSDGRGKGIFAGDGSTPNYPALLLFLAGGALSGASVYDSVRRGGSYVALLIAALLCAFLALALFLNGGKKE
ncbi:MAG TPA: hypothetical protein VJQ56_02255 [Blastocatellia bacterium]|nr:hypothetical protein [Blastocatellia bacterium]